MAIKQIDSDLRNAIRQTASWLGVAPDDLATVIGYETKGTFSPTITGGKDNNYRGLIQFGPSERRAYKYDASASAADQVRGPVYRYLADRGVKPGMGLKDIYSTVLTGQPGKYTRSDSGGSVNQHVARMQQDLMPAISQDMARGVSLIDDPDYVSTFQQQAETGIKSGPFGADAVLRAAMSGDPAQLKAALDQVGAAIQAQPLGLMMAASQLPAYFSEAATASPGAVMIAQRNLAAPDMRALIPANLMPMVDSAKGSIPSDPFAWMPKPTPRPPMPLETALAAASPPPAQPAPEPVRTASTAPVAVSAPSPPPPVPQAQMGLQQAPAAIPSASTGQSPAMEQLAAFKPPEPQAANPVMPQDSAMPPDFIQAMSQYRPMTGAAPQQEPPPLAPLPPPVNVPTLPATPQMQMPNLRPQAPPADKQPGVLGNLMNSPIGGLIKGGVPGLLVSLLAGKGGGGSNLMGLLNHDASLPLPSNITNASWSGSGPVTYSQGGQQMSSASGGPNAAAIYRAAGVSVNKDGQIVREDLPNLLRFPGT